MAHLQANRQIEISNRTIVNGIMKRIGKAKGNWVEEIPMTMWSYRTTPRTGTRETPFSLTYGTEAMLPMEVMIGTLRTSHTDEDANSQDLRLNLDILEEKRDRASLCQAAYKRGTERY